jgi:hypothetical protein
MRTHIAKSLQTRCKAIRTALKDYNAAAASLDAPRPALDWSQVSNFNFLEEFTLLQDTRNDVRAKPWCKPAIREAMKLRHRLTRAREEIDRLNVEIRRLHTAIRDERRLFKNTITRLRSAQDPLLGAVLDFVTWRSRINDRLLARVHQVYALNGYTGLKSAGKRLGGANLQEDLLFDGLIAMPDVPEEVLPAVRKLDEEDDAGEDDDAAEEEPEDRVDRIVQFISDLAL